jgi:hypothetical protein
MNHGYAKKGREEKRTKCYCCWKQNGYQEKKVGVMEWKGEIIVEASGRLEKRGY